MIRRVTSSQSLLAQIALALVVIFALLGLALHGFSASVLERIFTSIAERPGGPMTFRFILQPLMACVLAAVDGFRDARSGATAYLWSIVTGTQQRAGQIYDGVIATARVIILGLGMDIAYQAVEFHTFYPGEAAIVAVLLAFIPYLLLRGPFARLARLWGIRPANQECTR